MNSARKTSLIWYLGSLIFISSNSPAQSQLAEETSVSEPTQLHIAVEAEGSMIVRTEWLGALNSADSGATVFVIDVQKADGKRERGVKISLQNATSSDHVYVPQNLLSNFRSELREIEHWRHRDGTCKAQVRCVHGIARCRPSQATKQAYCPGRFSTPNSVGGFILSTPRYTFMFPSVESTQLDELLDGAE